MVIKALIFWKHILNFTTILGNNIRENQFFYSARFLIFKNIPGTSHHFFGKFIFGSKIVKLYIVRFVLLRRFQKYKVFQNRTIFRLVRAFFMKKVMKKIAHFLLKKGKTLKKFRKWPVTACIMLFFWCGISLAQQISVFWSIFLVGRF